MTKSVSRIQTTKYSHLDKHIPTALDSFDSTLSNQKRRQDVKTIGIIHVTPLAPRHHVLQKLQSACIFWRTHSFMTRTAPGEKDPI